MANQTLEQLIKEFSADGITRFFRERSPKFAPRKETLDEYNDDSFKGGIKLGEIKFDETEELIVCAFSCENSLSERSGKKAQYEKAKKVLKDRVSDAGIFVFYDPDGNFRFSLVYTNYLGKKKDWSTFKRFTYFVSKESTNKTFLQRIGNGDFSSLEKIQDAFSVEKVTKEFYENISYWYFWAVKKCVFPKDAEAEENGRNISVIRLITRIIFVWFMRERKLIGKELFDKDFINELLLDTSDDSSTYYQAILQNLFFATLSTKQAERQFRSEVRGPKGFNPDHGNPYVFRFQEYLKDPEKLRDLFVDIPFLNGGLFDCLDDSEKGIYIDGFSETKKNQAVVPNVLFFGKETKVDLSSELGEQQKKCPVQGLLNLLSEFNFTIDENTADDKDVALDPELLGRVFENLLASFNPETSTTARKATGSYYTPREIVDYMVDESLKGYLTTHLSDIEGIDGKISILFSSEVEENPFTIAESKKVVSLVESVRVVDPAVGSGAFPMGILNRLVFILHKVDPKNEFWKQAQIDTANQFTDPKIKQEAIERINEYFKKSPNYGRKLFLIRKCIYGVDIQQIAVEIAKLRFFISLLVDEDIDKNKNNWGIEPLPNLDFKIMQGNSLISEFLGVNFEIKKESSVGQAGFDFQDERSRLIKQFESKKIEYQNESDKSQKGKLLKEIDDVIIEMFELIVKQQKESYFSSIESIKRKYSILPNKVEREEIICKETEKINSRYSFDLENAEKQLREFTGKLKIRPFFPWQLYFAEVFIEKKGFDLIIGNPPYLESRSKSFPEKLKFSYQNACRIRWGEESNNITKGADLLIYFFELSLHLLNENGKVTLITQNAWLDTIYGRKFQQFLLRNSKVQRIVDSDYRYFPSGEGPNINTVISIIDNKNSNSAKEITFIRYHLNLSNLSITDHPIQEDQEFIASQRRYKLSDKVLQDTKWGVLLGASNQALQILSLLGNYYYPIEKIKDHRLSYGQGLNLTKDFYIDITKFHQISKNDDALIPILTSDDGALFEIHKTMKFLINKSKLTQSEKQICKEIGVKLFTPESTSKRYPFLIMPRGIGRHYCAFTSINCYSSSGVDIYDESNDITNEVKMNLWLFFNSSVAWLMRETLGRKNLGGGMLKAEAADLENLPVYFDFQQPDKILSIFNGLKSREALSSIEEISSPEHQRIDELVFDSLEFSSNNRRIIQNELTRIITLRNSKSIT
jgi:adenine-specific DNA-methyltransferase